MRLFLISFLLISNVLGQIPSPICKSVEEIALMERMGHDRLSSSTLYNATAASANFDVKYYRLEWEVDPAVNYIKGKVTAYFTMLSTATTVSFDLMNGLVVDSVKRRGVLLTKQHLNNVLDI